tara:strand:- start:4475 stop:4699 length:225 start_codon:yes stop_codon:yes gene_type:complete
MATTNFSGPVNSTNGFIGDIKVPTYTVANAPSASDAGAGTVVFVSNGAAGSAILAFSDGTNWKRSDTGATIAAS